MAYTRPDNVLWCQLGDGGFAAFSYHIEHGVEGWTSQGLPPGYSVESIAALPGDNVNYHLWAIVHRVKGGVHQRRIWRLSLRREAIFMDGCLNYAGAPATHITGLGVYEGEPVSVLADGGLVDGMVVAAGAIDLPYAASLVYVGFPPVRDAISLPLDLQGADGTIGELVKVTNGVATISCVTCVAAVVQENEPGQTVAAPEILTTRQPQDMVPVVRRKRHKFIYNGGVDRDVRIRFTCDQPFDLQIHAIRARGTSNA